MMGKMKIVERKNKGISKWLAELAIMVFAVIIVAAGLYFAFPDLLNKAIELFTLFTGGGGGTCSDLPTSHELEAAIKCAYYRCAENCSSDKIKSIEINTPEGLKKCKEDFCDPFKDETGAVCGDDSKLHPVEFTADSEAKIAAFDKFKPLEVTDSCGPLGYDMDVPVINIEKILTTEESTKSCCGLERVGGETSAGMMSWFTQCDVKDGTYFIYTAHFTTGSALALKKDWQIVLCSKTPWEEIKLEPDTPKEIKLPLDGNFYSDAYKIVVTSSADEAVLKVESLGSILDCIQDHPRVSFTCEETEHSHESICVGEPMVCGKFSLTFKDYEYPSVFPSDADAWAVFDIVYSTTPTTTTTIPACSGTGCISPPADGCICGSTVCPFGSSCCSYTNVCFTDPSACSAASCPAV